MVSIKAVFFDLDDTLCNTSGSRRARAEIAARILCEHEPSLTVEDLVERMLAPVSEDGWPRGVDSLDPDRALASFWGNAASRRPAAADT